MAALEDPDRNSNEGNLSFGNVNKNFRITNTQMNRSLSMSMWAASRHATVDLDNRGYSAESSGYNDHELKYLPHLSISGLPFFINNNGDALWDDPDAVDGDKLGSEETLKPRKGRKTL
jgi:hypothetical protein